MEVEEPSNESFSNPCESDTIIEKLSNGELTLSDEKGRSKVWEVFAKIIDKDRVPLRDVVCCRDCDKLMRYKNFSTSNLIKHKCYLLKIKSENPLKVEVDEATKNKITQLMTEWIVNNCRPFNLIKDDGLQVLFKEFAFIGARFGANIDVEKALPHPTTISRNVASIYEQCFSKIKQEIASVESSGFGLTTDVWIDDYLKKSYIALTIHFVKKGILSVRLLGLKSMQGERCTSENIFKKVEKLLMDFGCNFSSKTVIVTDRSCNMKKAFQNTQHLVCMSHLLNNTLQKSMEAVAEVADLCNHSAKLVNYFEKSGLNASLSTPPNSFCLTRWNTHFYMLTLIEKNWEEMNQLLQSKNELSKIDFININYLKAVINVLQPFEEASKHLEGENYATLHLAPVYLHQLKAACISASSDLDFIRVFKDKLLLYLDTIVMPHITILHKVALFLFPPTNKLLQFSDVEKQSIYDECVRFLKCFPNDVEAIKEEVVATSQPPSKYSKLFSGFVEDERYNASDDMINHEIQLYKSTRVLNSADFNAITWWELQKSNFPYLYKLSCIIFATPASSASSERVFSAAKNLLSERRYSLSFNEVAVNQIMFIHFNNGKDAWNN